MENPKDKFDLICTSIPTYKLCNDIGIDAGTTYILDLTTEENYKIANDYLIRVCKNGEPIEKRYIGEKVVMEMDISFAEMNRWYIIHGNIDEYLKKVEKSLKEYMGEKAEYCEWIKYDHRTICPRNHNIDNPYWRIPENMDNLKYCPYCSKEIRVIEY